MFVNVSVMVVVFGLFMVVFLGSTDLLGGKVPASRVRGQHGIKDVLINKTNKTDKSDKKSNRSPGTTGGSSTPSKAVRV